MRNLINLLFAGTLCACTTPQTLAPAAPSLPAAQTAPVGKNIRVSIGKLDGLPQSQVKALRNNMVAAGASTDIIVEENPQQPVDYKLDGTFGAIQDISGTLISYRWTVVDARGTAVHSFLGTANTNSKSATPWSSVSEETIRQIAAQSVNTLQAWQRSR